MFVYIQATLNNVFFVHVSTYMYAGQICVQDYSNKINHQPGIDSIFSHHIHQLVVLQESSCHLFFLAVAIYEHPSPKLYINIGLMARTYMYVHTCDKKRGIKAAI